MSADPVHRDPLAGTAVPLPVALRPEPGPIAILPTAKPVFADAVTGAGGVLDVLNPATRGLVWVDPRGSEALRSVLREHPGISWVQLPWAGIDAFAGLLHEHAQEPTPLWTSAKGAYAEPVAEHAVMLALALMRGIPEKARSRAWATSREGISLFGREVVIVGAGGVAREVIRLLTPWRVRVTVVRRSDEPVPGAHRTLPAESLREALPDADAVVLAAAATDRTAGLIGADELAMMKPTAVLVNIARGALVDSLALDAALRSGHLAGAGLDVTDPEPLPDVHPLWSAPRCVITSHSADTDPIVEPLLAGRIRDNVRAFLGDGAFVGVVDPAAGY